MRVSYTTIKRIERIELSLAIGRPIGLWPKTLAHDDWEAIALPLQAALQNESTEEHNQ